MKKLAIIGLGFIGETVIDAIISQKIDFEIQAIYDINEKVLKKVQRHLKNVRIMKNLTDFSDCDVVIECAVQSVVEEIFDKVLEDNMYFIPMSIGAFVTNESLYLKYQNLDEEKKKLILLPSGAIGGFDSIDAISLEGLNSVMLETRKPYHVFEKSAYVIKNGIKLDKNKETIIFEGNAKEAAKEFPRSINVAARLSLATLGREKTRVRILSDPLINQNIHRVFIESNVGSYEFTFKNKPSPSNPKTSWLAALSLISFLKKIQ
ncbi:MAG: aspartate dehydrogenase domain-containing protein [Candidatus Heimdallarchaeaceae archaeon]